LNVVQGTVKQTNVADVFVTGMIESVYSTNRVKT